ERQVTEVPEPEAARPDQWRGPRPPLGQGPNGPPEEYPRPVPPRGVGGQASKGGGPPRRRAPGPPAGRPRPGPQAPGPAGGDRAARGLASRGVVLSAGSLAAVVSLDGVSAGVPDSLMSSTVKAAAAIAAGPATVAGAVPARVAILTDGVLKAMLLSKLKNV